MAWLNQNDKRDRKGGKMWAKFNWTKFNVSLDLMSKSMCCCYLSFTSTKISLKKIKPLSFALTQLTAWAEIQEYFGEILWGLLLLWVVAIKLIKSQASMSKMWCAKIIYRVPCFYFANKRLTQFLQITIFITRAFLHKYFYSKWCE